MADTVIVPEKIAKTLGRLTTTHTGEYVDTLEKLARGDFFVGEFVDDCFKINLFYEAKPLSEHDRKGLHYWQLDARLIELIEGHDHMLSANTIAAMYIPAAFRTLALYEREIREVLSRDATLRPAFMNFLEFMERIAKIYRTTVRFPAEVHPEINHRIDKIIAEMSDAFEKTYAAEKYLVRLNQYRVRTT
jgi:hypothetical protein